MLIQNEYCDGGSLASQIEALRARGQAFSEEELLRVLRHTALGLRCLHAKRLAHLDIKPDNIFIKTDDETPATPGLLEAHGSFSLPATGAGGAGAAAPAGAVPITRRLYKVGDLGHVTQHDATSYEEGDSRYMARELLDDAVADLTRADIFSLGAMAYEMASSSPLPKSGDEWHWLRDDNPLPLHRYSPALRSLIASMLRSDPAERPTAIGILQHKAVVEDHVHPVAAKSREQLRKELNAERMQSHFLQQELDRAQSENMGGAPADGPVSRSLSAPAASRLARRSHSVSF